MSRTGQASGVEAWAYGRARLWRVGWASGCALIFLIDAAAAGGEWPLAAMALIGAALPALAGLALGDERPGLQIAQWAAAGCVAAALAGGITGPFAAFCLSPLAASAALGGRGRIAAGGAWSLAAALALGLLQLASTHLQPLRPAPLDALLALALIVLATGFGLAISEARSVGERRERDEELSVLGAIAAGQSGYLLRVQPGQGVTDIYGAGLPGLEASHLFGLNLAALADEEESRAIVTLLDHGEGQLRFNLAHDSDRVVELELRLVEQGSAGVLRDISAQRAREDAAEEARRRAEAESAGRSRFLAAMSHELRTPLNAIIGFSDVMRMRLFGPLSDRYGEYVQLIHESGQHLLDLISDVLDISKIDADRYELTLEPMDAREPAQAALRLVRAQADMAGIALRADLNGPLEIEADRRALKQIVLNLVSNALKFTPKGGAITVAMGQVGTMLELSVSDTGVGIAAEDLERLGRPFEQAGDMTSRRQGTGLGLSLVRAFARLHGGEMAIESVLGEGTTVTVRLPLGPLEPSAQDAPVGDNVVQFPPMR